MDGQYNLGGAFYNGDGVPQNDIEAYKWFSLAAAQGDIVSAKLSARAALDATGSLPENVNYAVKSSFLLSFLESVPAVSAKLKEPVTADRKFEDVVKSAQDAAVLVLVY